MNEERKSQLRWVGAGLGAALLIAGIVSVARWAGYLPGHARDAGPLVGQPAPSFVLPLIAGAGAAEGDQLSLEALRGEVVVLDFWASWCGPCRRSIPILNEVHEAYGERIHVIGVNVESGSTRDRVERAHAAFGARFPSVWDQGFATQSDYGVANIPTILVIDREGVVRWQLVGVPSRSDVEAELDALLEP